MGIKQKFRALFWRVFPTTSGFTEHGLFKEENWGMLFVRLHIVKQLFSRVNHKGACIYMLLGFNLVTKIKF